MCNCNSVLAIFVLKSYPIRSLFKQILKLYCIFCYFFNIIMILFFYLWDDCALCHLVYLFTTKPPCYCRSRSCPNTLAFDLITFPSWQRFLVVKDFHFRWANCKTKEREGKFSLGVKFNSKAGTYDYTYILELDVSTGWNPVVYVLLLNPTCII